jgi:hypothetical protein
MTEATGWPWPGMSPTPATGKSRSPLPPSPTCVALATTKAWTPARCSAPPTRGCPGSPPARTSRGSCCRPTPWAAPPSSSATAPPWRAATTSPAMLAGWRSRTAGPPPPAPASTPPHGSSATAATWASGPTATSPTKARCRLPDLVGLCGPLRPGGAGPGQSLPRAPAQSGGVSFGAADILDQVARSANAAMKAAWYHKWLVHRRLRPEEAGGRIHHHLTGTKAYPLHPKLTNSAVLERLYSTQGSYLCPQADPEGCPTHPAYPGATATIGGAGCGCSRRCSTPTSCSPTRWCPATTGCRCGPGRGSR